MLIFSGLGVGILVGTISKDGRRSRIVSRFITRFSASFESQSSLSLRFIGRGFSFGGSDIIDCDVVDCEVIDCDVVGDDVGLCSLPLPLLPEVELWGEILFSKKSCFSFGEVSFCGVELPGKSFKGAVSDSFRGGLLFVTLGLGRYGFFWHLKRI